MQLLVSARRGARSRSAGFSMTEVLIGALLLASLLLVAGLAVDRSMDLFRQRRASEAVTSGAHRLLQRVAAEFAFARQGSLVPAPPVDDGTSSLSFQKCLGVQGGAVAWSTRFAIEWEREPGEADDGADNDGDGLVDEGQLVWVQDEGLAAEQRVVWGHGLCEFLPGETFDGADEDGDGLVDERGLCFSIADEVLTIRIGLQGAGLDGTTVTRVVETSVRLRN